MHMTRSGVFLAMVLVIGLGISGCAPVPVDSSQFQAPAPEPVDPAVKYLSTIPPEVLEQYDPKVFDDTQRTVAVITQSMIWQLRDGRPFNGEVFRFDLDPAKLSTVQKEIIRHWISDGRTVLLWGEKDVATYAQLFPDIITVGPGAPDEQLHLAAHAVNTDVHTLYFLTSHYRNRNKPWYYRCVTTYPTNTEIIASVSTGGLAGKIPFGKGTVYFASIGDTWDGGADKDRWELNFRQWMLHKPVPRAALIHAKALSSQAPPRRFIYQAKMEQPAHTYIAITGDRVNIRMAPRLSAPVVAQALKGDIFIQHGKEGKWYIISMFSGEQRYVHTAFARETPSHVAVPPDVLTRREIFNAHRRAESRLQTDVGQSLTKDAAFLAATPTDKRTAAYEALLMDRYRLAVAHQFGIRVPEYRIIVAEGLQKGW